MISAILKKKKQPEVTPTQDTITQEKLRTKKIIRETIKIGVKSCLFQVFMC